MFQEKWWVGRSVGRILSQGAQSCQKKFHKRQKGNFFTASLTREPLVLPHSDFYETYLKESGKNSILRICMWFNTPIFLSRDIEVKSCTKKFIIILCKKYLTYVGFEPGSHRTKANDATNWATGAKRLKATNFGHH